MDLLSREDNLKKYLISEASGFLFSELDDDFLRSSDLSYLSGVPIPIKQDDLKEFTGNGLSMTQIADNMAVVIGADYSFKHTQSYIRYLRKLFDEKVIMVFASKARELFNLRSPRKALCYLRAGLLYDGESLDAVYAYAMGCREWYLSLEGQDDEKLISILKAEALECYAELTTMHPDFAPGWYYLGYAYLNSGVYKKAQLSFNHYLQCSSGQPAEDIKEIRERVEELNDPVQIERGVALLSSGKTVDGLQILESYIGTEYENWWPLHFYLGSAYRQLGHTAEAVEGFLNVLELNPSNYDAMKALSELYDELGDKEKAEKYRKKAELVLSL